MTIFLPTKLALSYVPTEYKALARILLFVWYTTGVFSIQEISLFIHKDKELLCQFLNGLSKNVFQLTRTSGEKNTTKT